MGPTSNSFILVHHDGEERATEGAPSVVAGTWSRPGSRENRLEPGLGATSKGSQTQIAFKDGPTSWTLNIQNASL